VFVSLSAYWPGSIRIDHSLIGESSQIDLEVRAFIRVPNLEHSILVPKGVGMYRTV